MEVAPWGSVNSKSESYQKGLPAGFGLLFPFMEEIHIPVSFKARYYLEGGHDKEHGASEIWFVLHGQGQLAAYFIKKFNLIVSSQRKVIAPEGLSRYYLDGFYGRVGSTWMTKENRGIDIENYLTYLTEIYYREVISPNECKITVLGFSQGAATASRWALMEGIKIDRLILWAGLFPPDLDFELGTRKLENVEIVNVYGEQDEYLTQERVNEQFQLADRLGIDMITKTFKGGHTIDIKTLQDLIG